MPSAIAVLKTRLADIEVLIPEAPPHLQSALSDEREQLKKRMAEYRGGRGIPTNKRRDS